MVTINDIQKLKGDCLGFYKCMGFFWLQKSCTGCTQKNVLSWVILH